MQSISLFNDMGALTLWNKIQAKDHTRRKLTGSSALASIWPWPSASRTRPSSLTCASSTASPVTGLGRPSSWSTSTDASPGRRSCPTWPRWPITGTRRAWWRTRTFRPSSSPTRWMSSWSAAWRFASRAAPSSAIIKCWAMARRQDRPGARRTQRWRPFPPGWISAPAAAKMRKLFLFARAIHFLNSPWLRSLSVKKLSMKNKKKF